MSYDTRWFQYQTPTADQAKRHREIQAAELYCLRACKGAKDHANIDSACVVFADAIDKFCPGSADKTAAFRCLRLARNAAHERLVVEGTEEWREEVATASLLRQQLRLARYNACAAIAMEEPDA